MPWWAIAVVASGIVPLALAWYANRHWTSRHAIGWSWLAWLAWLAFAAFPCVETCYATVTLTSAVGVAILGARRPGDVAWNFIVASLLIVLWLGWAESLLDGSRLKLGEVRLAFVTGLIVTVAMNYVPTRLAPCALLLAAACLQNVRSLWLNNESHSPMTPALAALGLWSGLIAARIRARPGINPTDRVWSQFKTRFGAIWAERLREQFNTAARNNGWPASLRWGGISAQKGAESEAIHEGLAALMKRFRFDEKNRGPIS